MDKRQQYALVNRRRGELAKALREGIARFAQMGIRADVFIPQGKDNVAFLLVDEEDLVAFLQRKIASKMKRLGKDITVKSSIVEEVVVTKIVSTAKVDKDTVEQDVNKTKEELSKMKIKSEVFVDVSDYVTLTFLMELGSVVRYFDEQVKKMVESNRIKVAADVYREKGVMVVRFVK